jgi:hypothetical protein
VSRCSITASTGVPSSTCSAATTAVNIPQTVTFFPSNTNYVLVSANNTNSTSVCFAGTTAGSSLSSCTFQTVLNNLGPNTYATIQRVPNSSGTYFAYLLTLRTDPCLIAKID